MSYREAVAYLESLVNYEKIPYYPYKESVKLARIKAFLTAIHNPHNELRCIHVAGTKGKGSTCAFIAYMLRAAGYRVGLYTSPHLSDFRERIRILRPGIRVCSSSREFEGMITKGDVVRLLAQLKPAVEKYCRVSRYGPLSFFEVYTSLAFLYFKEKRVDFAVLETGLGGRLDATNAVNPLVCAITPISYEHTRLLGNTLWAIAKEKAGIIKSAGVITVSAPQRKGASSVIHNRCRRVGARLFEVGRDIHFAENGTFFSVKGLFGEYPNLKIRLPGRHQRINASVAVAVIEGLRYAHIAIGDSAIRNGLREARWPGRCEVISRKPLVVLDGAQNTASSDALKKTIKENFKYKKLILVLGISQDKDIQGICDTLKSLTDTVILTQADNPRAAPANVLAKYCKAKKVYMTNHVREAKAQALAIAGKEDLVLVTGSLFVVGEIRRDFLNAKRKIYHG